MITRWLTSNRHARTLFLANGRGWGGARNGADISNHFILYWQRLVLLPSPLRELASLSVETLVDSVEAPH